MSNLVAGAFTLYGRIEVELCLEILRRTTFHICFIDVVGTHQQCGACLPNPNRDQIPKRLFVIGALQSRINFR